MRSTWLTIPASNLRRGAADVDLHTAVWNGPDSGPPFVCVHGLGGSHLNWSLLAPLLAEHGRVHAPDLAGFGLTPPTGRTAHVRDNVDLLAGFIRTISPNEPVVLLGNSMGGLISLLLSARRPELVSHLVLASPASPRPLRSLPDPLVFANFALMATPGLGERVLEQRARRLTPAQQVELTMRMCAVDPTTLDELAMANHAEMVQRRREMPYAAAAMLQATRSLLLTVAPPARRFWHAVDAAQAPTLLVHGAKDRLVLAASMRALARRRPDWTVCSYDDLGHIVMLEAPQRMAADVLQWMSSDNRIPVRP